MFNLDNAIAEWRRQLSRAGIRNPDALDELESHLREDIEQRGRDGTEAGQVFQSAAAQLGRPKMICAEFEKVQNNKRSYMKRGLIIAGGIVGVLVGMALVMPAVAQYRHDGAMRNEEPWLFLIGSFMTLAGCVAAIRNLKKVRA